MTEYAILNTDLNRFLTSASGRGIWDDRDVAERTKDMEFGGGEHLEVVKVER